MVAVPAGSFMMGSPESEEGRYDNEGPLHKVTIAKPFAVGKFAITVEDYLACVNAGACKPPEWLEWGGAYNISSGADPLYKKLGEVLIGNRYPMIGVSWDDAKSYVNWLSKDRKRLPAPFRGGIRICRAGRDYDAVLVGPVYLDELGQLQAWQCVDLGRGLLGG